MRIAGARLGLIVLAGLPLNAAGAAGLTGAQILQRSAAAYGAVRSYSGTTTVRSRLQIGRINSQQTATAAIRFQRPNLIRIEGKDTQGHPYRIVSDGHSAWLFAVSPGHSSAPGGRPYPAGGGSAGWQQLPNLQTAIIAETGITAGAPTVIPAALLPLRWGNPFSRLLGAGQLAAPAVGGHPDPVGGHDCYRIVSRGASATRTYWVDRQSFLLRQMKEEQNAQQLSSLGQRLAVTARVVVYSFGIDRLNAPMPAALFRR